jgi:hypothetical protein
LNAPGTGRSYSFFKGKRAEKKRLAVRRVGENAQDAVEPEVFDGSTGRTRVVYKDLRPLVALFDARHLQAYHCEHQ